MEIRLSISHVSIDIPKHMSKAQGDKLGKFAAMTFKKYMDKYVPFKTGMLANGTAMVKPWAVWYTAPYAHYQYEGQVYGPNYPISSNGVATGFFSPPSKHPTGASLQYHGNPMACRHWDEAADAAHHDELIAAVQAYVESGELGFGK